MMKNAEQTLGHMVPWQDKELILFKRNGKASWKGKRKISRNSIAEVNGREKNIREGIISRVAC